METQISADQAQLNRDWLKTYSFLRAGASIGWIALALLVGKSMPPVAAVLLVAYPAWDALANFLDAQKSGGLGSNLSQTLNVAASVLTAVGVAIALGSGMKPVLMIFGAWALFAGVFQLLTGVRRWKAGGQGVMILSGGQSALVSFVFFKHANMIPTPGIEAVAPYAALGAIYFLISAIWLTVKTARQRPTLASA